MSLIEIWMVCEAADRVALGDSEPLDVGVSDMENSSLKECVGESLESDNVGAVPVPVSVKVKESVSLIDGESIELLSVAVVVHDGVPSDMLIDVNVGSGSVSELVKETFVAE